MAGSFRHIIDTETLEFLGDKHPEDGVRALALENLGDTYEALEECYDIIMHLSKGNRKKIAKAHLHGHIKKRTSKENFRRVKAMQKKERYL